MQEQISLFSNLSWRPNGVTTFANSGACEMWELILLIALPGHARMQTAHCSSKTGGIYLSVTLAMERDGSRISQNTSFPFCMQRRAWEMEIRNNPSLCVRALWRFRSRAELKNSHYWALVSQRACTFLGTHPYYGLSRKLPRQRGNIGNCLEHAIKSDELWRIK